MYKHCMKKSFMNCKVCNTSQSSVLPFQVKTVPTGYRLLWKKTGWWCFCLQPVIVWVLVNRKIGDSSRHLSIFVLVLNLMIYPWIYTLYTYSHKAAIIAHVNQLLYNCCCLEVTVKCITYVTYIRMLIARGRCRCEPDLNYDTRFASWISSGAVLIQIQCFKAVNW